MKFFQKTGVAVTITVLAVVAALVVLRVAKKAGLDIMPCG